jgi:uncharacterized glyoxalase superfamily protein PhnB
MASGSQSVVPMLSYEDGPAAMDWLIRVFGFVEQARWLDENGVLTHGELIAGDGMIMLATPTPDYESPRKHREHCEAARKWSEVPYIVDGVLVHVDDLDAHFLRAREGGAVILSEVQDGEPGKRYRAEDLEGHRWYFIQSPLP